MRGMAEHAYSVFTERLDLSGAGFRKIMLGIDDTGFAAAMDAEKTKAIHKIINIVLKQNDRIAAIDASNVSHVGMPIHRVSPVT